MQEVEALVSEVKSLKSLKDFKLVYKLGPKGGSWPHGTIEAILLGLSSLGQLESLEVSDQHSHVDLNR